MFGEETVQNNGVRVIVRDTFPFVRVLILVTWRWVVSLDDIMSKIVK